MAKKTDTASVFRMIAGGTAFALIAAAGLIYLQSTGGGGSVAALSQAVHAHADQALAGEVGAFDELAVSIDRLQATDAPETEALINAANTIAAQRADIVALTSASAAISDAIRSVRGIDLLGTATNARIVEGAEQRIDRIERASQGIAASPDPVANAAQIAADVTYLQSVGAALAGEPSPLDQRALSNEQQEAVVVPLRGGFAEIAAQSDVITHRAAAADGLGAALAETRSESAALAGAGAAASGPLPGFLALPWVPMGLTVLAAVLVLVLIALNQKSAVFERTAREQAEQNERNQQAILRLLDERGSLADGDLTVEATVTEDITGTIADSFNYAIEELRNLVTTVNETAIMVDSAAKQTENTAAHMAKAAENQTKEINAATESIVSMAASIEEVSGNAERSSDVARHSVEVAHKGGEAVRRTIDGMNTIRETIQETSKRIKRLGESSQEIGNIVELINDIAEQTNILALNASIQASMAGEAGRGFAVVADEVQRLAERSTNATKQIEVLVSTIQADTKEAVVSMERSTTDVVGGALLAENAGAALDEIEQVSNQIASLVQNISGSARQQASSAADVTRRTTRLSEISAQTGKATTATAAAISKLSEFASQLRKSVAGFTLPASSMPVNPVQPKAAAPAANQPGPGPAKPPQKQVSAG